jgi:hypothetical protein
LSPGTLHLGEVHTQLLRLLLGGLRSVRLLLLASSGLLGRLLSLLGCLTSGVLCLLGRLSGRLLSLLGHLSGLIGDLSGRLLGLPRRLSGHVLRLLGGSLCGLLDLLLGLLGSLLHRILDAHVLGRLIHRALEFHVGVDHLLDLGLRVAIGNLLGELLQLGAVILDLALKAAYRLPVEVLGVLRGLLLHLLLKILSLVRHFVSILLIDFAFGKRWG